MTARTGLSGFAAGFLRDAAARQPAAAQMINSSFAHANTPQYDNPWFFYRI